MKPVESKKIKNPQQKFVVTLTANGMSRTLSPVPSRFNSTSEPTKMSIVRAELSSVTEPAYIGSVFSNRKSTLVP